MTSVSNISNNCIYYDWNNFERIGKYNISNKDHGNCVSINILTYILIVLIDPDIMTSVKNERIPVELLIPSISLNNDMVW